MVDETKTTCFRVNRIQVNGQYVKKADSFYIGIASKGSGSLKIGDETWPLAEGSKFFIPFHTGAVKYESDDGMEITATFPPK